ncbi:MAG: sulfite exporter TauE/SafE family protein, partial [bacterium]|nr:sulfite exporter TauE/SafE family protein [bacterium]
MGILLIILFYFLFLVGAFVFAAVGMGGASFYIPIMLLYGYDPDTVATTCLVLNIVVAALSFVYFRKYFRGRYFWPVLAGSIPGSFLGGYTNVDDTVFVVIVIVVMLLTAAKLVIQPSGDEVKRSLGAGTSLLIGVPLGLALGYVSGIIGIGGGIFLSPLLILAGLVVPRTAAAIAGLFIATNSVFALAGHLLDGD